jgi:hypothetical protein
MFVILKPINDEEPVVVCEPLGVEAAAAASKQRAVITNASLLIVDFDTRPDNLTIRVDKFPKHGKKAPQKQNIIDIKIDSPTRQFKFNRCNILQKKFMPFKLNSVLKCLLLFLASLSIDLV